MPFGFRQDLLMRGPTQDLGSYSPHYAKSLAVVVFFL